MMDKADAKCHITGGRFAATGADSSLVIDYKDQGP